MGFTWSRLWLKSEVQGPTKTTTGQEKAAQDTVAEGGPSLSPAGSEDKHQGNPQATPHHTYHLQNHLTCGHTRRLPGLCKGSIFQTLLAESQLMLTSFRQNTSTIHWNWKLPSLLQFGGGRGDHCQRDTHFNPLYAL